MNIYISRDDKKIENFQTVKIQNFQEEMSRVVTNSCENIVADEIVDFLSSNSLSNFIQALSSKLRLNGKLFITGIEIGVLCRHTISEDISSNDFSSVIAPRASLSSVNDIVKLIKESGLDIESSTIKGLKYEISATRR